MVWMTALAVTAMALGAAPARAAIKKEGIWKMDAVKAYAALEKSGQPTVLHFWATWCTTCATMHPTVEEVYETFHEDVNFVLVDIDDPEVEDIVDDYDAWEVPLTVFENQHGKVVAYLESSADRDVLEKGIKLATENDEED